MYVYLRKKLPNYFYKVAVSVFVPTNYESESCCSDSGPEIGTVIIFDVTIPVPVSWCLHIPTEVMWSIDVFVYLFAILISLVKSLFKSFAYFSFGHFFSYYWIIKSSFVMLDTKPLLDICVPNIFSLSVPYPFIFLKMSFTEQKTLFLIISNACFSPWNMLLLCCI